MAKKVTTRKISIADAVSSAWSTLEELAEEMREAFDNTPESLQSSGVGERRGEAADALESLSEPDVPEELGKIEIEHVEVTGRRRQSRSSRRDDACALLDSVVQELDQMDGNQDAEDLSSVLTDLRDEAEGVEFPGMFG